MCVTEYVVWQFPMKMQHFRNPPNRETQIPRYLAIQIQIGIWICTEEFEFLDSVDFGGAVFSVQTVKYMCHLAKSTGSHSFIPMIQTYNTVYLAHCVCTHVWLNMLCKCVTQYCIHVSVSQMKKSSHTDSPAVEYPLEKCVVYTCRCFSREWMCCIHVLLLHVIECVVWMCHSMCCVVYMYHCSMWLTALYKCVSQCVVLYTCVIISCELCAHSFITTIQTHSTVHLAHCVVYMCHWYECTVRLDH